MRHPLSFAVVVATLVTLSAACGPLEEEDQAAQVEVEVDPPAASQGAIQLWGKNVTINPQLAHWRRDLEAQVLLSVRKLQEDPAISSVSPNPALAGQTITIRGTNFNRLVFLGQSYVVSFQAGVVRSLVAPLSTTNTEIRVVVPANATTGLLQLVSTRGNTITQSPLPLTITIPQPTTGVARFTNNSQFEVSSLLINGNQMIPAGQVVLPGGFVEVVGPGATVNFRADVGFNLSSYFFFEGPVTITNGQTVNVSIPRVTSSLALTQGAPSAVFDGIYWDGGASYGATLVFHANGTFELWDQGHLVGTASYRDGAFLPGSSIINFTVDGRATSMDFPYQSFLLNNGPPAWPTIQYSRR